MGWFLLIYTFIVVYAIWYRGIQRFAKWRATRKGTRNGPTPLALLGER